MKLYDILLHFYVYNWLAYFKVGEWYFNSIQFSFFNLHH